MENIHLNILLLILTTYYISSSKSARILGLFQVNGRSHVIIDETLMKALSARGHQVDVVSNYPLKTPLPNYNEISINGVLNTLDNNISISLLENISPLAIKEHFWVAQMENCRLVLESEPLQKLLKSETKYDLIITEVFASDCLAGFAYKFKVPIIFISTSVPFPWVYERVGNPDNPSYMPNYFTEYGHKMSFRERLFNTVIQVVSLAMNSYYLDVASNEISRKHFGEDMPHLSDIVKNTSLILVNSNIGLHYPRPTVPAMIDVGGLHIQEPKRLTQELETFLNESEQGVIYLCLGTLVRPDSFPASKLQAIIDVLSEVPQRILWKGNDIPGLPKKFKTGLWFAQNDILHHPKVRLFITHGGLLGTMEAVHAGVPMVGIPFLADQPGNIRLYESLGIAVYVNYKTMDKEIFQEAVNTVLGNSSFRENALRQSRIFRDRPMSALDTAVFWTEYVIRHGGALHLRSAALDLSLFQYLLLDVIAVILVILVLVVGLLYLGTLTIYRKLFARNSRAKLKTQ